MDKIKTLKNSLMWGFILWLIGYVLGISYYMIMPVNMVGWVIMPIATIITIWVLLKKIKRERFTCYIGIGVIWTLMAIILDYIFNVRLFNITNYYKLDIYIYYLLTFFIPIMVGYYKMKLKVANK
jgi:hypothetical protein